MPIKEPPKLLPVSLKTKEHQSNLAKSEAVLQERSEDRERSIRDERTPPITAPDGEERAHVEREIQRLSPAALREMKDQLIFSKDPRERREAALYVLNAAGHGKKEAQLGGAGSIIVIAGLRPDALPWQTAKIIDAKVIDERTTTPQISAGPVQGTTGQG